MAGDAGGIQTQVGRDQDPETCRNTYQLILANRAAKTHHREAQAEGELVNCTHFLRQGPKC